KIDYSTNNGSSWTVITASTANDGHYAWAVPATPSSSCLVRVSEIDGSPSDTSDSVFTIAALPVITIIYPNGGEQFEVGFNCLITWNTSVPVASMKVEYSVNNGSTWTTLVESTSQYSYNWTIPDTPSDNCLVRVTDNASGVFDVSDAVFSIVFPPAITVTSPNGGETWETNSLHDITWTSQGIVGDVNIEYSTNNGTSWTTIIASTPNDGTHPWTVPDTPSNNCLVRVREIDNDPEDTSDVVFSIVIPASITITSPNGGEAWETGSSHDITWTSSGTVGNVKIEFTTTNGSSWTTIVDSTANDGKYNWAIPDNPGLESDTCRVRITDIDTYPTDTSDGLFSLVLPPAIFVTSPNGGESWEVGDYHVITWDSQGIV
ncbi:MAG: hypothetical protein GTO45_04340, partial [Candidatus Aminicenantes bacterium]|nr:hypothetical protein [Candidatus Aminicenantes bacterium]NIM77969.1 hypothetical protein [Candidatus Aminicenantes bacterium]NIN17298.1 hypothetical protein [Candidatus Aminicenantes bacterium]NIN41189.1 hypothetical protein [Candidatus Aminicenantes bacterium]NIN83966.1 hypothetical protein [Candidatus Aminicenantes bacterium]